MKTLAIILAALASVGCTKVDTFKCTKSAECTLAGVAGVCEPAGLCSFPDPECPSGKAFGELAGDQADRCVDVEGTTDPTPTPIDNFINIVYIISNLRKILLNLYKF